MRITWESRQLIVFDQLRRTRVPLERISGLVLRCVHWYSKGTQGRSSRHMYSCVLEADVRGEDGSEASAVRLLSTQGFQDEPETPYDAALPLTRQLAEALGVKWRVVDYE